MKKTQSNKKKPAKKKKKSGGFSTVLLAVIILAGLSLLLYPSLSNYINSLHASTAITDYVNAVTNMNAELYEKMISDAIAYNEKLALKGNMIKLTEAERAEYNRMLDVTGTGIMGYIEINKINCFLPIYHGTGDEVLQVAVGHVESTSLPIGGKTTHAVLSGHRGLPSAKLFSDLNKLVVGDTFIIQVLNETLTYSVDQIRVVLPSQVSELGFIRNRDYVTLVTCTPYGINTHRLLVRAHRVTNEDPEAEAIRVVGDALRVRPTIVAPIVAAPIFLVLMVVLSVRSSRDQKRRRYLRKEVRANDRT